MCCDLRWKSNGKRADKVEKKVCKTWISNIYFNFGQFSEFSHHVCHALSRVVKDHQNFFWQSTAVTRTHFKSYLCQVYIGPQALIIMGNTRPQALITVGNTASVSNSSLRLVSSSESFLHHLSQFRVVNYGLTGDPSLPNTGYVISRLHSTQTIY